MKSSLIIPRLLFISTLICFLFCSGGSDIAGGGGTRGGNPVLAGIVVDSTGHPVHGARVSVAAADFDPLNSLKSSRYVETSTDSNGRFAVAAPVEGALSVTAWDPGRIHSGYMTALAAEGADTVVVSDLRITKSRTLVVQLPHALAEGRAALTGTSILCRPPCNGLLVFTGVPENLNADVGFRAHDGLRSHILVENIQNLVRDRDTISLDAVKSFSRRILLNTSSEGADVAQDIHTVPVLIRLDSAHRRVFEEASKEQLWFQRKERALPVQVETWDSVARSATIWVLVDTVEGNDTTALNMYWSEVPSVQIPNGEVFDTANGFVGVYHLADQFTGAQVLDATQASRHGIAEDPSFAPVPAQVMIGGAQRFGERTTRLKLPTPAVPDGIWTLSAWFLPNGPINQGRIVGDSTGGVRLSYGSSFEPSLQRNAKVHLAYAEGEPNFKNLGDGPLDDSPHYLVATCDTSEHRCSFYIDGAFVGDITWATGTVSVPSPTSYIGGGYVESFVGLIDEVRIERTQRSAQWQKLCYENQRPDGNLVEFR